MSDDNPFTPPGHQGGSASRMRPMSIPVAFGWTTLAMFLFIAVAALVLGLRSDSGSDAQDAHMLVTLIGCQVLGYSGALVLIQRVHAPDLELSSSLGLRRTAWGFYVLGLVLGALLQAPLSALFDWLHGRWPIEQPLDIEGLFSAASPAKQVLVFVSVSFLGPAIEEVLFRGALFRPLLKTEPRGAATVAVVITSVLFSMVHLRWQQVVVILPLALAMGWLRYKSGSLVPCLLCHVAFNAAPIAFFVSDRSLDISAPVAAAVAAAVFAAAAAATAFLGRTEAASRARAEDLA